MDLQEVKMQLEEWLEHVQDYFAHLTQEEKYGWIGESVGVACLVTGIVLLIA